ncbi:MAG: hypothetical protein IJI66_04180 [Erysipelotrichaceae bacterium]|nr:hypothetical protein [Erysipelotrichaceae bacterium]
MKKSVIITICLLSLLSLCGCKKESEEEIVKEVGETIEITFINETEETTDVWVLPDIEANRKTSIWGKAMIEKLPVGSEDKVIVEKQEEDSYLLRVIDKDQLYYEANDIIIKEGYTLKLILDSESFVASLEVTDETGNTQTYEVFCASL